ncbi:MAG: DUF3883 domain-containing protein [Planctomycetales bacterium]|nr:DUF3883 domain-containing protein [Planctomycetales bacterium]
MRTPGLKCDGDIRFSNGTPDGEPRNWRDHPDPEADIYPEDVPISDAHRRILASVGHDVDEHRAPKEYYGWQDENGNPISPTDEELAAEAAKMEDADPPALDEDRAMLAGSPETAENEAAKVGVSSTSLHTNTMTRRNRTKMETEPPTKQTMRHYIAYHKVKDFSGYGFPGKHLWHYSSKPRSTLEKTVKQTVWVISGEKINGTMIYKLCSVFCPCRIEDNGKGFSVVGDGAGFNPHIDVTETRWLPVLLDEQNNFRFGLNEIKNRSVINGLLRTRSREAATDAVIRGLKLNRSQDQAKVSTRFGAGFGAHPENEAVEKAAVAVVTNSYRKDGWEVQSVERDRCGFDLRCSKGKSVEDVEVKGVSSTAQAFIITAGEVRQAEMNDRFVVCVVTNASSKSPKLTRYVGSEFLERFSLAPIQYRAVLQR